jgi:hypothetical protein
MVLASDLDVHKSQRCPNRPSLRPKNTDGKSGKRR